ncbi:EAL domain-containing protein [Halalkalibacter okhensis]|uniref:EAL domain-containing protein n=1 Tax=Halalkalibacter okhensis TaxID=333138 RepID=UPI000689BCC8|nr:EAL domain-containing protein [Halalkalibacter okhensis]
MNDCQRCSQFPELKSKGYLLFHSKNTMITHSLKKIVQKYEENDSLVFVPYTSFEHLEEMVLKIRASFTKEEKEQLVGTYTDENKNQNRFVNMTSFPVLSERLKNRDFVSIINKRMFTQHLQPIISLQQNDVFGYEFLLRPLPNGYPFSPGELFSFSQRAGLQSNLDSQARIASIEISSRLVKPGVKRFINFLPSSIYDPNHCLKSTFKAVEKYGVAPTDLVFEVVETEKIQNMDHLKMIFRTYQEHGMKVALDDLGSGFSSVEVLKELKPNFTKIDRSLIAYCDQDQEKQSRIKEILDIGNAYGMTVLAEGIERPEEAQFCQQVGISLAQGYFFGKPNDQPLVQDQLSEQRVY